jgi:hypothetical protein
VNLRIQNLSAGGDTCYTFFKVNFCE